MRTDSTIYVAGMNTLIGAAIIRRLRAEGFDPIGEEEPDLTCADAVAAFFAEHQPAYVFHTAGKSGGIAANQKYTADLIRDNLLVSSHVIHAAHVHGVRKLLYLGSSCSYPRLCPQPMAVEQLMSGPLEPTNAAYATAKLAGIELCRAYRQQHGDDFIVGIPANAFGPGDDFDADNAHVIGALIRRMHEAKEAGHDVVTIWGSGAARREFIFADDLATPASSPCGPTTMQRRSTLAAAPISPLPHSRTRFATWSASGVDWNSTAHAPTACRARRSTAEPSPRSDGDREQPWPTLSPLPITISSPPTHGGRFMLERFYASLYRIRRVEERIAEVYPSDKIQSPVHLSIGQEAISVGVCEALAAGGCRLRHLSLSRALPRQGGRPRKDDRRAVRQGDGMREGQGWVDAPDRHRHRRHGCFGRCRHDDPPRGRPRLRAEAAAQADRDGLLLRRRRRRGRRLSREPELRRAQESTDPPRLRE